MHMDIKENLKELRINIMSPSADNLGTFHKHVSQSRNVAKYLVYGKSQLSFLVSYVLDSSTKYS